MTAEQDRDDLQQAIDEQTELLRQILGEQRASRLDRASRTLHQAGQAAAGVHSLARVGLFGSRAQRFARGAGAAAAGSAAARILPSFFARAAPIAAGLGGPVGIAAAGVGALAVGSAARRLGGPRGAARGGSVEMELSRQTQLLQTLVTTSRATNTTIQRTQALQQARIDPYMRGAAFAQQTMAARGVAYSPEQQAVFGGLADVQNRLNVATEARSRARSRLTAPFRYAGRRIRAFGAETESSFLGGMLGERIGNQRGYSRFAFRTGQMFGGLAGQAFGMLNRSIFGDALPEGGPLGGPDQRRLFQLQLQGPGISTGPPMTATAGTESEYRARVGLQTEQLNRQATLEWQAEVLAVLRRLVDQTAVSDDELYRTEIRYGRDGDLKTVD